MNRSETIVELATALSKFQGEVTNPANSKTVSTGSFSYKYSPLDEILSLIRPLLSSNGLSLIQAPVMQDGMVGVTTTLLHKSGEWMEFEPILLKLDKQSAQGAGSAITYSRRYAISSILGISSEDDDDANSIEPNPKSNNGNVTNINKKALSEAQIKRLFAIANSSGIDADTVKDQVKRKYNKEVSELSKTEYDAACTGYENVK